MKRTMIAGLAALTLGLAACGEALTATQACVESFGPGTTAVGTSDEERLCVQNGQPIGEVEAAEFGGWTADD